MRALTTSDPEVAALIRHEEERLAATIDLIAAENHPLPGIFEALGSAFAVKAAEGYPAARYHAGCAHADALEDLAIRRCCALFGAEHANVQPHSGVAANWAVYFAALNPGDRVLAMRLSHGGHLSHGAAASVTSRCFQFEHYGLDPDSETIDYDAISDLAARTRPRMLVAGASAYPRLIDYARLAEIAAGVSALFMVDMAHIAGLVAAGVIPSPLPHADYVTFTTYKTLGGGRGGVILCREKYRSAIDRSVFPGCQGTPAVNMIAAKAVCFNLAAQPDFRTRQEQTVANARYLGDALTERDYRLVAGGTDNHLVLIDLRPRGISGEHAENALAAAGLFANRNPLPFENTHPNRSGGLRLGTPAITSRGMGKPEVELIADWIDQLLRQPDDPAVRRSVQSGVAELTRDFPLPC
ncbi:MAG: serine hydroxymethyltransferase [Desulfobacterales bacterium]|nr:serine hydroxymethyltransferase [Desulfobacterales bacterium]